MNNSRFDYVKYDFAATKHQEIAKTQVIYLEKFIETFAPGENRDNAIKALEECYMWVGKVIRDDQLQRNIAAANHLHDDHGGYKEKEPQA